MAATTFSGFHFQESRTADQTHERGINLTLLIGLVAILAEMNETINFCLCY